MVSLQELDGSTSLLLPITTSAPPSAYRIKEETEYETVILHQSTILPQRAAPMFDRVYCLQPSVADNP